MSDIDSLPYRPAAGIMLINHAGQVFVGQRMDSTLEAWQMPQGGIDEGEDALTAALRELGEETGIAPDKVELIALSIDNTKEAASTHLESRGWNKTTNAWAGDGGFRAPAPTAYGVRGIPSVFVIDAAGKIAANGHPGSLDLGGIVDGLLAKP